MTDVYAAEIVSMMTEHDLTEHDNYIMEMFDLDLDKYRRIKQKFITWETFYMPPIFSHKELIRRFVTKKLETDSVHDVCRQLGRSRTFVKHQTEPVIYPVCPE